MEIISFSLLRNVYWPNTKLTDLEVVGTYGKICSLVWIVEPPVYAPVSFLEESSFFSGSKINILI